MKKSKIVEAMFVLALVLVCVLPMLCIVKMHHDQLVRIEEMRAVTSAKYSALKEFREHYQGAVLEHRCEVFEISTTEIIIEDFADESLFAIDPDSELAVGDVLNVLFADHATESRTDDEIIWYHKILD